MRSVGSDKTESAKCEPQKAIQTGVSGRQIPSKIKYSARMAGHEISYICREIDPVLSKKKKNMKKLPSLFAVRVDE